MEKRFWSRVERSNDHACWPWQGSKQRQGYGRIEINSKVFSAHRLSYMLNKGQIPAGLVIDHLCCNKSCVNPTHLEAVTLKENAIRRENNRYG